MATIAAVIASTHHPFYYRASTSTGADRPPFADEWVAKITSFRETLTRANPDVLVLVGSDHFHQLWLDNMPQFLVGKAPFYDANWYNEEREFGLPLALLRGFALLARAAGLLGQLAEEQRMPIANDIYLSVDRNAVYIPPNPE
ncbi:MAG: protocatechuate 4,5-dioxygenase, beta chain [Trebonia sp.]|nr:protocatechuate 4,5-dioxygenase, beta chain [Trebonia sp.]